MEDPQKESSQSADIQDKKKSNVETNGKVVTKRKKPWWLKLIFWILVIPIALSLLITLLFYFPPVQRFAANTIAEKVSKSSGMQVTVGTFRIGFPLKLKLENVLAKDAANDTVAYLGSLQANVPMMLLLAGDIPLNTLDLQQLRLQYASTDSSFQVSGHVDRLLGHGAIMNLKKQRIDVRDLELSNSDVSIYVLPSDTVKVDTTSQPSHWYIETHRMDIKETRFLFSTRRDSIDVAGYIQAAKGKGIVADVGKMSYDVGSFSLDGEMKHLLAVDSVDLLVLPWTLGLDASDIHYDSLNIRADISNLLFLNGKHWGVDQAKGKIRMDAQRLDVQKLELSMNQTELQADASVPMKHFVPDSVGEISASVRGSLWLPDLQPLLGSQKELPEEALSLQLRADGTMEGRIALDADMDAKDMAHFSARGSATQVLDALKRRAELEFELRNQNVMEHLAMFGIKDPAWYIPPETAMTGTAKYSPNKIELDAKLQTANGHLDAVGHFLPKSKSFRLNALAHRLSLQQFLPKDTIGDLQAKLKIEGQGTDLFSPKTRASIDLAIDTFTYNNNSLGNIILVSKLEKQQLFAALSSDSPGATLMAQLDAQLKKNDLNGSIHLDVDTLIPSLIGLKTDPILGTSFKLLASVRTDTKEYYQMEASVEDAIVETDKKTIRPTNLDLYGFSSKDSIMARLNSGDLRLDFHSENGLKAFLQRLKNVGEKVQHFAKDSTGRADIADWIPDYPDARLHFTMERNNFIRAYLDEHRYGWRKLNINLSTSPDKGLQGDVYMNAFQKDTFRIDEIDVTLYQDTSFFYAVSAVHKEKFRNQQPFNAQLNLTTNVRFAELFANLKDKDDEDVLLLGMNANWKPQGIRIGFTPDPIVLGYNHFNVTDSAYLHLPFSKSENIRADLQLLGDDRSEISVKTTEHSDDYVMKLLVQSFGLRKLKALDFLPQMSGLLNVDAQWLKKKSKEQYTLQADLKDFKFQAKEIGHLNLDALYEPVEKGGNYASANVLLEGQKVIEGEAFLPGGKEAQAVWRAEVTKLPLDKADPFIPEQKARLKGTLDARVSNASSEGDLRKQHAAKMHGRLQIDQGNVFVSSLNNAYGLDEKAIEIVNGRMLFDRYQVKTLNESHLNIDGSVELMGKNTIQLSLLGEDVTLVDSEKTSESLAYGLLNINTALKLSGPAAAMNITGRLDINGNTNLTYVNKDSKLENRNRFKGLVEFTEFRDTLFTVKKENVDSLSLGGMDVRLSIHVDPAVQLGAELSADESSMVHVQVGGDLNFRYPPFGQMYLSGRVDFNDGYIKYNAPPILSKNFKVNRDSYIVWNGNVMNPTLNFKATERIKANVDIPGQAKRKVNFDVSIVAKNTLDNLSLVFDLDAPEDVTIRNNITAMTEEERQRQAIMLLAWGTYQNSSREQIDMNNQLVNILAKELNSIMGEALDAEVNFGVENGSNYGGLPGTYYSYSIAKKFYDDRITLTVGGQVESSNRPNANQSFIDNVQLDYRIDKAGTHYLRLFHNKNYENILDGEVIETGAGYVIRRRLHRLQDLFKFKKRLRSFKEEIKRDANLKETEPKEEGEKSAEETPKETKVRDENNKKAAPEKKEEER